MTATYAPADVQVVEIDDNMPATQEYGDYRGFVIEVHGVWEANASDLDDAKAQAAAMTGTAAYDWSRRATNDMGAYVWDFRA